MVEFGAMGVPFTAHPDERVHAMCLMVAIGTLQVIFLIYVASELYTGELYTGGFTVRSWRCFAKLPLMVAAVMAHGIQCLGDFHKGWRVRTIARSGWYVKVQNGFGQPGEKGWVKL